MGRDYFEPGGYPRKPFPTKTFVDGIKQFIKTEEEKKIQEEKEKLRKMHMKGAEELEKFQDEYLENVQQCWVDLIESLGITDNDIKEIIGEWDGK